MVPLEDTSIISHPVPTGWMQSAERNAGKPLLPQPRTQPLLTAEQGLLWLGSDPGYPSRRDWMAD